MLVFGERQAHRPELGEPARAAELAAAPAHAVQPLGLVARADLAQLDPRVKQAGEVAHQRAKVHALLGREVDRQVLLVPLPLGVGHLHREGVLLHPLHHLATHLRFVLVQPVGECRVVGAGAAHDAPLGRGWGRSGLGEAASRAPPAALAESDGAEGRHASEIMAPLDFHDHGIVQRERLLGRPDEVFLPVPLEPDFHDWSQLTSRSGHPSKGTSPLDV